MKKKLLIILTVIVGLYIILCGLLYFFQEMLIFFPQKLEKNYKFNFKGEFKEINIKTSDGKLLNGLLFNLNFSPNSTAIPDKPILTALNSIDFISK